jgi:hypothetical protein
MGVGEDVEAQAVKARAMIIVIIKYIFFILYTFVSGDCHLCSRFTFR